MSGKTLNKYEKAKKILSIELLLLIEDIKETLFITEIVDAYLLNLR
jgi:hypothetical protein